MNDSDATSVVVIGLGGIGSWLLRALCPYLQYPPEGQKPGAKLLLVDGDRYTPSNASRQLFDFTGESKASVSWDYASDGRFPDVAAEDVSAYVGERASDEGPHKSVAVADVVREGDTIFLCVDNHATRRLVFGHAATLRDVTVISGGNDFVDGNVLVYARRKGRNVTPDPLSYHPEIAAAGGKRPDEMSCEELAQSGSPQLVVANMMAATLMMAAYHNLRSGRFKFGHPEVCFDVAQLAARPCPRSLPRQAEEVVRVTEEAASAQEVVASRTGLPVEIA